MLSEFVRAVDANGLTPLIHRTFGFDDAPAAFDYFFTSLDRMGKIVIEVA